MKTIIYDLIRAFDNDVRVSCIDELDELNIDVVDFTVDEYNHLIEFQVENVPESLPSHIILV